MFPCSSLNKKLLWGAGPIRVLQKGPPDPLTGALRPVEIMTV